ncbi:MAG TPA: DUF1540 domain-containing protein [Firmicutes bacterium]|jgi:UDP-3-O-[3-hydroxymyristoyl] glucosamine N-acyltransferase|nr:DUF1540 domain-containing protein [Bacillota bacterium]HOQ23609.1 DUF1540 domain-containing protein [Bacillota bacterium]HPT68053.1 DUF1540 domain-containing protein [Bacillota bacterium]
MSRIYCSIDNCHYWDQGNVCKASEILVAADDWAAKTMDYVDAPQHKNVPQMQASSCMETCCKTFVPNNSPHIKADGVTKMV